MLLRLRVDKPTKKLMAKDNVQWLHWFISHVVIFTAKWTRTWIFGHPINENLYSP